MAHVLCRDFDHIVAPIDFLYVEDFEARGGPLSLSGALIRIVLVTRVDHSRSSWLLARIAEGSILVDLLVNEALGSRARRWGDITFVDLQLLLYYLWHGVFDGFPEHAQMGFIQDLGAKVVLLDTNVKGLFGTVNGVRDKLVCVNDVAE